MKIENSGLPPLSPKPADGSKRVEKKNSLGDVRAARVSQDRVEMSEDARLLSKARAALGAVEGTNLERLAAIRRQIDNGDYTVQVTELARRLAAGLYPK